MLVHVKTPRTEIEIKGEVSDRLMKALRNDFGNKIDISDDDMLIDPTESVWFKETKAQMTPGDLLKIDRENAGWSQTELGKKIGSFSRQYVSDLENGRKNISLKVAKQLANIFDRSVERYV
jgi:DNA-binding XRE family transcriptional regulator